MKLSSRRHGAKIDLQMTLGGRSQNISLGEGGTPLALPTSVTLAIGSGSGQLGITAVATNVVLKERVRCR